ncbi:hypothetical protein DPM19_09405 [Actinomadura craniellae]|uniref:Radical SAM core domain-containing protein n=1 Tax=Actinomadura craniellae TaxID=2231787 RepID=A0A365HAK1_9ACTN|nr:hypothetical protein DPM19_09405 [Actinomadura craniellae]
MVKVHSRCNLSCDHCYVYEHADQSWRRQPPAMAPATVRQAARRIAEHAAAHRVDGVLVVLHGGEPTLLGPAGLRAVLAELRAAIEPVTRLDLRIHTNGVLLDERLCELFAEYGVRVGVSLDGDRQANDLHRRYADGRSSHRQVLRGLALLRRPEYRHLYAGILCTVDLAADPIRVYEALLAERPPRIDLLLPHATWDAPPPRPAGVPTPYADWLGRVHARWTADGRPVPVRLFDSISAAARGGPSGSEAIGLDPVGLATVETDGSWEQADSLKTAFDGAAATGMDVFSHSVDDLAAHPGAAARRGGLAALCATCRACPVVRICGGGLYAHRHRAGHGFDNPSVYCADLKALIARTAGAPRPQAPRHALPEGAFDALAAGPGDAAAVTALAEMRLSLTRALVAAVAGAGEPNRLAADGWALLADLDTARPEAVRAAFMHPYTQAWAVRCLRPPAGADPELDRAHLAGVAAAAAMHAGERPDLLLPVRDGALHVPGHGALRVGAAGHAAPPRPEDGEWLPVRRAGGLAVDDLDPFRDCQDWPAAGRLSPAGWDAWSAALEAALGELRRELPGYAAGLDAGLRAVVPLRPDPAGHGRSGTARHAFGAVAVALPPSAADLSVLLVHEFQHVKLSALLDMYGLFDPAERVLLRVPWRPDPRPVEGVLHGVYAHLAIAELWRVRARAGRPGAEARFERHRSEVRDAIEAVRATRALTAHGERFVAGMHATVTGWS